MENTRSEHEILWAIDQTFHYGEMYLLNRQWLQLWQAIPELTDSPSVTEPLLDTLQKLRHAIGYTLASKGILAIDNEGRPCLWADMVRANNERK